MLPCKEGRRKKNKERGNRERRKAAAGLQKQPRKSEKQEDFWGLGTCMAREKQISQTPFPIFLAFTHTHIIIYIYIYINFAFTLTYKE